MNTDSTVDMLSMDIKDLNDVAIYGTTSYWNDSLTHAEVLKAFDLAIEEATADE
jgi:6-phosphogluconate dehydrogenase (decarboxylating)